MRSRSARESRYPVLHSCKLLIVCFLRQYVEFPASSGQPVRQLRGFDKIKQAAPGSTTTASFP